jgi:hypothetical protein
MFKLGQIMYMNFYMVMYSFYICMVNILTYFFITYDDASPSKT